MAGLWLSLGNAAIANPGFKVLIQVWIIKAALEVK